MRVTDDVLAVLSAAQTEGHELVLSGQLDRQLYTRANKVIEAAGGKWNRKAKAHVFDGDAASRIDQVILTGSIEVPKDEFEFFRTPPMIVNHLMHIASIMPGMIALEPSAGDGAIAFAMSERGASVDCIEYMEANYKKLLPHSDGKFASVKQADFLSVDPVSIYDRVVMNPPFAKQADVKHVMHALKFLNRDGLLIAVMSAGLTFRENRLTSELRTLVNARGGDIEPLEEGAFKESGTMVRTVVVTIPQRA